MLVALAADQVDVRVVRVRPLELLADDREREVRQVRAGEVVREVGRGERERCRRGASRPQYRASGGAVLRPAAAALPSAQAYPRLVADHEVASCKNAASAEDPSSCRVVLTERRELGRGTRCLAGAAPGLADVFRCPTRCERAGGRRFPSSGGTKDRDSPDDRSPCELPPEALADAVYDARASGDVACGAAGEPQRAEDWRLLGSCSGGARCRASCCGSRDLDAQASRSLPSATSAHDSIELREALDANIAVLGLLTRSGAAREQFVRRSSVIRQLEGSIGPGRRASWTTAAKVDDGLEEDPAVGALRDQLLGLLAHRDLLELDLEHYGVSTRKGGLRRQVAQRVGVSRDLVQLADSIRTAARQPEVLSYRSVNGCRAGDRVRSERAPERGDEGDRISAHAPCAAAREALPPHLAFAADLPTC